MSRMFLVLVLWLPLVGHAWAEEPVYFADARLKAAVEDALWLSDPTPTDMLGLTDFYYTLNWWYREDEAVTDLTGLEYATNLQTLHLRLNQISDISVLSALSDLETLDLSQNCISDISPLSGLVNLTYLNLHGNQITDISALSGLTKIETLSVRLNRLTDISALSGMALLRELDLSLTWVADISPLSGLTELSTAHLEANEIRDISPLSGATNLNVLGLSDNCISDISPLSGLHNLTELDLNGNQISDVSPLCGLTSLSDLDLRNNWLNEEAYRTHIPQIIANNPGISISHDSHPGRLLSVSSTAGGSVIHPGVGEFVYDFDAFVRLEAKADAGFVFAGWSGTYRTPLNPAYITMDQDYQMQATFLSLLDTLYVDDDARDDPGPGDAALSDANENGTAEHPFDSIQEAVKVAAEGASILVDAGTYRENIDPLGKNLQLIGMDPNDPNRASWPAIEGAGAGPVVRFDSREGPQCRLMGFVITQGKGQTAGAILCDGASPAIAHCLIVGNRATDPAGAIVYCQDSQAVLSNCTLADNYAGPEGAALMLIDSDVTVLNSILWNDRMINEILAAGASDPNIQYCGVRGWWADWGNIHKDPLFARPGVWVDLDEPSQTCGPECPKATLMGGDYHLKSQIGRWDPEASRWVHDEVTSPCIDAGLPTSPVEHEPVPNGDRINMGAYGGTAEASLSGAAE